MCALSALMRRQGTHREMRESDDRVEVRGRSDSAQRLTFLKGVERVRASTVMFISSSRRRVHRV